MSRDYRKEMEDLLEMQGGLYGYEDILECIQDGRMQSFAHINTWVITQVHQFPRKKVLEVAFVLGDIDGMKQIEPRLYKYADDIGAEMVMATGRMGWLRSSFPGWKPVSVNFVRK